MHKMTQANLGAAFAGESQAHMKYLLFAERAEGEYPVVAKLFRAIAYAEMVHAGNHLDALGGIKGILDNLQTAVEGETFETDEMYPAYFEVAKLQEEKAAMRSFVYARQAESVHAGLYAKALDAVSSNSDTSLGAVYVCSTCGHTVVGEAPEKCPVCAQSRERFKKFD